MSSPFLVETFVAEAKARMMAKAEEPEQKQTILKEYMQATFLEAHSSTEELVTALDAVAPASISIAGGGQSVIHADDDMIWLWNQIPARFQSG
jgi:hypothetical protein